MEQAIETEAAAEAAQVQSPGCARCGKTLRPGWVFVFKINAAPTGHGFRAQPAEVSKCTLCALRHAPMLRRSLTVAVVVGTALTLLNQGDTILAANWKNALYWKIPLTYCVPFLVATYGALGNSRR